MNFIDPDSFVDPDQHPKGAWSEVYKKYLANHRAGSEYDTIPPIPYAPIPGAEAYDNTPPMSYDEFSKLKDKEYRDRLIAVPETALHMGLGMGSAVLGGLVAPLAPVMPWAHTRDPQKMFEDISALPSAIPKLSDKTDDYLRSVGSVMQAFPATGNYPGLLRPMKVGQAAAPTVQANLKALAEKKKAAKEVPPVVEEPIPDTLANRVKEREKIPLPPSQLKEWKATQDKFIEYQRTQKAQEAVNARQQALEQDVASQRQVDVDNAWTTRRDQSLEAMAAERARQEQAPTGYAEWVEQQRNAANTRQPGNNQPMDFQSPYPVDANDYPNVLGEAKYQPDNFIDPDTAGQKALPITVADILQTGVKSEDPFARTNASRTVARNILETDLHPPIIKTVDAAITAYGLQGFSGMGKNQRGALDFSGFNKAKQKLIEEATKSKLWAQEITGQQVVDEALAHGKDAKGATNFSAGGSLEAEKRSSPLVRGGVRILQRFKNQSENAIRESVFPTETALRKLSRNELADLGEAFKQEMFLRERFSMEELAQAGLNEKQLLAYKRTRDMFTDALEAQNKVREIQGLKRISENEAYLNLAED